MNPGKIIWTAHICAALLSIWSAPAIAQPPELSLFLSPEENERINGVTAVIHYVENGKVNRYSVGFVMPIKPSIDTLRFMWRVSGAFYIQPTFTLDVKYDNPKTAQEAIGQWDSNVNKSGKVPTELTEFSIKVPCTGKVNAEIPFTIQLKVDLGKQSLELDLKRKKICTIGVPGEFTVPPVPRSPEDNLLEAVNPRLASDPPKFKIWIILGSLFAGLVLIGIFVMVVLSRSNRKEAEHLGDVPDPLLLHHQLYELNAENELQGSPTLIPDGSLYGTQFYSTSRSTSLIQPPSVRHPPSSVQCPPSSDFNPPPQRQPPDTDQLEKDLKMLEIDPQFVNLREQVAAGTFGLIHRGELMVVTETGETWTHHILMKTVRPGTSRMQLGWMIEDAFQLYGIKHENIITLARSITTPPVPILIYWGNGGGRLEILKEFLVSPQKMKALALIDLVGMGLQLIHGLQHLHSNGIVHKDIAARNCLIVGDGNTLLVALTDGALARDLFPSDYHCLGDCSNRPIKWLAYESLIRHEFSPASDVWSFGVLLWEIFSLGQTPFQEIDGSDMADIIRTGHRLPQPPNCPDDLYKIVTKCWVFSPEQRLSVQDLSTGLNDFNINLSKFC